MVHEKQSTESNLNHDERFLWNMFMLKELLTFRSRLNEQERGELDSGGLLVRERVHERPDLDKLYEETNQGWEPSSYTNYSLEHLDSHHTRICRQPTIQDSDNAGADFCHFQTQLKTRR